MFFTCCLRICSYIFPKSAFLFVNLYSSYLQHHTYAHIASVIIIVFLSKRIIIHLLLPLRCLPHNAFSHRPPQHLYWDISILLLVLLTILLRPNKITLLLMCFCLPFPVLFCLAPIVIPVFFCFDLELWSLST